MTGAGFGGCVVVLSRRGALDVGAALAAGVACRPDGGNLRRRDVSADDHGQGSTAGSGGGPAPRRRLMTRRSTAGFRTSSIQWDRLSSHRVSWRRPRADEPARQGLHHGHRGDPFEGNVPLLAAQDAPGLDQPVRRHHRGSWFATARPARSARGKGWRPRGPRSSGGEPRCEGTRHPGSHRWRPPRRRSAGAR